MSLNPRTRFFGTLLCSAFAAAAVSLIAQQPASQRPPQPLAQPGLCPFEGCQYAKWTAMTTVLAIARPPAASYESIPPGQVTPLFVVNPGEAVTAVTGVYVTRVPGRARIDKPISVRIKPAPGQPDRELGEMQLSGGDVIYYYDCSEGDCQAWFKGRWFTFEDATDQNVIERASYVWWVQIKNSRGLAGWTDQAIAFAGTDMLGGPEPAQLPLVRNRV